VFALLNASAALPPSLICRRDSGLRITSAPRGRGVRCADLLGADAAVAHSDFPARGGSGVGGTVTTPRGHICAAGNEVASCHGDTGTQCGAGNDVAGIVHAGEYSGQRDSSGQALSAPR